MLVKCCAGCYPVKLPSFPRCSLFHGTARKVYMRFSSLYLAARRPLCGGFARSYAGLCKFSHGVYAISYTERNLNEKLNMLMCHAMRGDIGVSSEFIVFLNNEETIPPRITSVFLIVL